MTKELLMEYFSTLFKDCFLFWKREEKDILEAYERALEDIRAINKLPQTSDVDVHLVKSEWNEVHTQILHDLYKAHSNNMLDSEHIRICSHCGLPMIEGYHWGDERYCSKECLDAVYSQEEQDVEMYMLAPGEQLSDLSESEKEQAFNSQDECYWTQWESIIKDEYL